MAVHATLVLAAVDQQSTPSIVPEPNSSDFGAQLLEDRMQQNVLNTHTEVLSDQNTSISEVSGADISAHCRGSRRFDSVSDKAALLSDIETNVVIDAEWYEIRYHVCYHDETPTPPCDSWTVERSYGAVPSDV